MLVTSPEMPSRRAMIDEPRTLAEAQARGALARRIAERHEPEIDPFHFRFAQIEARMARVDLIDPGAQLRLREAGRIRDRAARSSARRRRACDRARAP